MKRVVSGLALVFLAVGCARPSVTAVETAATTPSAPLDAPTPIASAAPTAIEAPVRPPPIEDKSTERVRALVQAWSAALDRHDLGALASVYEGYVRLYGAEDPLERARVVALKRSAFAAVTDFHQELVGAVEVSTERDGSFTARFVKRSGPPANLADVRARQRIRAKTDGSLVITEESDEPSDLARSARQESQSRCIEAAAQAAHGVAEVNAFEASAQHEADESHGQARFGGIGPIEDGGQSFTVGIGFHTDERYEGHVWYTVNRATGQIDLTVDGATLDVGPDAQRRVRAACTASAARL